MRIREIALSQQSPEFQINSLFEGSKESQKASKLEYEYLVSQFKSNQQDFISDWLSFNLNGKEARENIFDLLWDYGEYCGNCFLRDIRSNEQKLLDDYSVQSLTYPIGCSFIVETNTSINNRLNIFKTIFGKKNKL